MDLERKIRDRANLGVLWDVTEWSVPQRRGRHRPLRAAKEHDPGSWGWGGARRRQGCVFSRYQVPWSPSAQSVWVRKREAMAFLVECHLCTDGCHGQGATLRKARVISPCPRVPGCPRRASLPCITAPSRGDESAVAMPLWCPRAEKTRGPASPHRALVPVSLLTAVAPLQQHREHHCQGTDGSSLSLGLSPLATILGTRRHGTRKPC